jgi:hypothetical protein
MLLFLLPWFFFCLFFHVRVIVVFVLLLPGWLPVRTSLVIQDQGLEVEEIEETHHAELKAAFAQEMGSLSREMGQRMEHLEAAMLGSFA